MNCNFADRERVVRYSTSALFRRVGPLREPQVCITAVCIQLAFGEKLQIAMLFIDIRVSIVLSG